MRDRSYVFKDAVDELFQGCGEKIPWQIFCLYLIGTLHIATDQGELVPEGGRLAFYLPTQNNFFYFFIFYFFAFAGYGGGWREP